MRRRGLPQAGVRPARGLAVRAAAAAAAEKGPVVVVDNYDSFTYNLCQVCAVWSEGYVTSPSCFESIAGVVLLHALPHVPLIAAAAEPRHVPRCC